MFADLGAMPGGPDGATLDADGYLWSAQFDGGCLVRYAPDGAMDRVVRLPVTKPTSCGFGGPGYRQLYVTTATRGLGEDDLRAEPLAGRMLVLDVGVAGRPPIPFVPTTASGEGQAMSDASSHTFEGYRRADGRVGVRNHVLVLSPTGLTSAAAARVSSLVRGTICVTTGYGRGQVAADAQLQFDTLTGLACHPNIAAIVVLSAGPDITKAYVDAIAATGQRVVGYSLPDVREDALALVDAGVRAATRLVRDTSALRRESCALGELCVAVECGHSDATSGLVCNPLAGRMTEIVVAAGGQAMFSETVEWTGAEHLLAKRAINAEVADQIVRAVNARERMVREVGGDIRADNPGPQNKAGGLTTIEEKALGAIAKGGTTAHPRRAASRATTTGFRPVPDGHAVLLAGVDHGDGRRRRADRAVHDRRRQQLLQPRRADVEDEREPRDLRAPDRADRHRGCRRRVGHDDARRARRPLRSRSCSRSRRDR